MTETWVQLGLVQVVPGGSYHFLHAHNSPDVPITVPGTTLK